MIRQAGWRFTWIPDSCVRKGFGTSHDRATSYALTRALNGIAQCFNAAELDSVQSETFLGFHMATVRLQPRQVQEKTSADGADDL